MALPLQPSVRPHSPWWRSVAVVVSLAVVVIGSAFVAPPLQDPPILLLSPGPDGMPDGVAAQPYEQAVLRLFAEAKEEILVGVYVCYPERDRDGPITAFGEALAAAQRRGVSVQVCLDLGREWGSESISEKHATAVDWLTGLGVPVVLDDLATTSHQKVVVVDRRYVISGSHNWTWSAMRRNRESSVLIDDRAWATALARWLQDAATP